MLHNNLPRLHAATLARILATLQKDARIDAVLGSGSIIHGGMDDDSDLDLVLIVRPQDYRQVMSERLALAGRIGGLLAAFTGEHVGEPRLLICLYGPELIHVDLKFVVLDDLDQCVERPQLLWSRAPREVQAQIDAAAVQWPNQAAQWFEDRAWIWLHYGATKLHRGELFEAIGMLGYFRENVLGPMWRQRAGQPQRGVRRIDGDEAARAALAPTIARYDADDVRRALACSLQLYLELRAAAPPAVPTPHMPQALLEWLEPH